ncbi:hypothetical protein BC629DRAFT_1437277 [Irpex lacteus]|nr:hypothetical protein BC629DRAFT_1437277 [Irpex lacteus]
MRLILAQLCAAMPVRLSYCKDAQQFLIQFFGVKLTKLLTEYMTLLTGTIDRDSTSAASANDATNSTGNIAKAAEEWQTGFDWSFSVHRMQEHGEESSDRVASFKL